MTKLDRPIITDETLFLIIDGKDCPTLKNFYENIGEQLQFPDYFAFNLDSFDELMNDLSWIDEPQIILLIVNFELFLGQEEKEKLKAITQILDNAILENDFIHFEWFYK
ncbi:MAG TPA: barstar family protein [Chitinophagales bacterium]|nr:barstar family protein [Chitinophagales bacterium]MCB0511242.1 barstar family protein [Bacteroidota bacterium]MCB9075462.1 barstar family protein [Chitinophagales bacterium]HMU97778.1 barstar family protein [Chitinophagales bacterium]HMV02780.1 barstar family protein [Chitinophagales bacterium]